MVVIKTKKFQIRTFTQRSKINILQIVRVEVQLFKFLAVIQWGDVDSLKLVASYSDKTFSVDTLYLDSPEGVLEMVPYMPPNELPKFVNRGMVGLALLNPIGSLQFAMPTKSNYSTYEVELAAARCCWRWRNRPIRRKKMSAVTESK